MDELIVLGYRSRDWKEGTYIVEWERTNVEAQIVFADAFRENASWHDFVAFI